MIALACANLGKSIIESQARHELLAEAGLMLDSAADWESDLIQRFRNDTSVHELSGLRETPMG